MDKTKISDLEFDNIFHFDAPKYSDAFIKTAMYDGVPMNQEQLDEINEDQDYVHEKLMNYLY